MDTRKRSYAIIGTGAVGGLYGSRLQQSGHEVHFLLNSDYDHVRKHGLDITSIDGDIKLPDVNAYANAADMPECDVVVVALKSTHNHLLGDILPRVTKKNGIVFLMQNGLGEEDKIAEICPDACIIGGLAFLCSNKTGPGCINHIDFGHVHIAEFNPQQKPAGITDNLRAIEADFDKMIKKLPSAVNEGESHG